MGKIYAWDDATKTDNIEYDDKKLNDLDKTRRENLDKIKLMQNQYKNDYVSAGMNANQLRMQEQRKRIQKKLYQKGLITKQEYDLVMSTEKSVGEIKEMAASLEIANVEMDQCSHTDYLDENDPTALKYGCLTMFFPKHIRGLKTLCYKIRGLFQTESELNDRIAELKKIYPDDRLYRFEVGKWNPISDNDKLSSDQLLKQLNYAMKCHIDNMEHEKDEFEKRRDTMVNKNNQHANITKSANRNERRRQKTGLAKKNTQSDQPKKPLSNDKSLNNSSQISNNNSIANELQSLGNNDDDDDAIKKIISYLDDPDTKDKFAVDKSSLQVTELGI